jgi:thiol-disulfide isomerase/thioredoxin
MKTISWKEAHEIALNYKEQDKVTLIMFTDENCSVCNEFVPTLPKLENEHYQVLIVEDGKDMPFPINSTPLGFVYIPNCPTKMPLTRAGNAPIEIMKGDALYQIEAFLTKKDYYEVRDSRRKERV